MKKFYLKFSMIELSTCARGE